MCGAFWASDVCVEGFLGLSASGKFLGLSRGLGLESLSSENNSKASQTF